jgi:hypothetical protein
MITVDEIVAAALNRLRPDSGERASPSAEHRLENTASPQRSIGSPR